MTKLKEYEKYFTTILNENINDDMTYVIDDNFSTKNILSTGGSDTLNNYIPIFDATVVEKLKSVNASMIGKTNISEFGIDLEMKSGAGEIIANSLASFGIGADSNGYLRISAGDNNVIGYKPTYGLISRHGLFAVAGAFDTVGIYANDIKTVAKIGNIIKGIDENDMNTWDSKNIDLEKKIDTNSDIHNKKLFYIKELASESFLNAIKKKNIKCEEISISEILIKSIKSVHNTIMHAEMTTTLSNLTGIPFGPCGVGSDADEMMFDYRSRFSSNTKKRLVMGCFTLGKDTINKFYINALRVRRLITDELNKLFENFDALISSNTEEELLIANLGGYPSIAIHNNLVITGKQKDDGNILNIAYIIDKEEA